MPGVKDYFHRLLCFFSLVDHQKAVICFGDFCDFYIAFKGGKVYKHFPECLPQRLFTSVRKENPLLHFKKGSIQHAAYVRMMCIWTLYEEHCKHFVTDTNLQVASIPYMMGIAMDTHINIIINTQLQNLHNVYKQNLVPEQYILQQYKQGVPFIWCEEMASTQRIYRTMQELWSQEITLSFGSQRYAPATFRSGSKHKPLHMLQKDILILRKGLPRPTSIRYIATQISKCLEQCFEDITTTIPSKQPSIAMALMCNYLGAYKHSICIAPPDHRLYAYSQHTAQEMLTLIAHPLNSIQLYNMMAEFIIAWSSQHSSLLYLLRRVPYWQAHKQSVLWQCNYVMQSIRSNAAPFILEHTPPKRLGVVPMRRALAQSSERKSNKNIMFYLYKSMSIRKRIPKHLFLAIASRKLNIGTVYKTALAKIQYFGIDRKVLLAMGMQLTTINQLSRGLQSQSQSNIRVSKLVSRALSVITNKCDLAILYLYLHALQERGQFAFSAIHTNHDMEATTKTHAAITVCTTCLSVRTKCKGERAAGIRNSGIALDLTRQSAYCCTCNNTPLCSVDMRNRIIQTPTAQNNSTPTRIIICAACAQAVCSKSVTINGQNLYCAECIKSLHLPIVKMQTLICGCTICLHNKKQRTVYKCITAKSQKGTLEYYQICERHHTRTPPEIVSVDSLQHFFHK